MAKLLLPFLTICMIIIIYYLLHNKINKYKEYVSNSIIILIVLWFVVTVIIFPKQSVNAAFNGLLTWFNIVLPSLLPFFIGSEILIGLGFVDFIGALLQPLMFPIFRVPGEGSFPLVMSITSGYPVGANLVTKLRLKKVISKTEAQRLLSFCSTSGPLFMIGAVAVGMFKNPLLGPLIALSHYLGALTVGLIFRFYGIKESIRKIPLEKSHIKDAFKELFNARQKDGRPLGVLMGDAVKESLNTMLVVGGFIILYSVIIEILHLSNIINLVSKFLIAYMPFTIDIVLLKSLLSGIVEMTNGCKMIAMNNTSSMMWQMLAVSFLIGWSGFCIHSQALSMLSKTDISLKIYILSKAFHGLFASIYCYILYHVFFSSYISTTAPMYSYTGNISTSWIDIFRFSLKFEIVIIATITFISLIISILNNLRFSFKN